jgi:hypothetical protein
MTNFEKTKFSLILGLQKFTPAHGLTKSVKEMLSGPQRPTDKSKSIKNLCVPNIPLLTFT